MTAIVTNAEASRNILAFAREGRLTQRSWHKRDAEGREIACLLGAIHPSVTSVTECNAELMPLWLAELTPMLFDGISRAAITPIATRYGELVGRWNALTDDDWREVLKSTLIYLIDQAIDAARPFCDGAAYWPAVKAACDQTKDALITGDEAAAEAAVAAAGAAAGAARAAGRAAARAAARAGAWAAAGAAAWAAARGDAWAAARAAEAAARAGAWAAAGAAAGAARAAGAAARTAAEAAEAARAAAGTAAWAAGTAANERIFTFVLDQIELRLN